jgi:cell fate regulator YaaT (PSP1 superfamily)
VGIKFKKEGKIYSFHAADLTLTRDDLVMVSTENGPAIGMVATEVQAVKDNC